MNIDISTVSEHDRDFNALLSGFTATEHYQLYLQVRSTKMDFLNCLLANKALQITICPEWWFFFFFSGNITEADDIVPLKEWPDKLGRD